MVVKGTQSYKEVRTYNRYREACNACDLLGDDQEWYNAFDEAAAWATSL